ncbi:hypothetical protein Tco_0675898 [Tanacetum coccineum]
MSKTSLVGLYQMKRLISRNWKHIILLKQKVHRAKIQEVLPAESSSTDTPLEQVQNNDASNVFTNERKHFEQPESINDTYVLEKNDSNVTPDSLNIYFAPMGKREETVTLEKESDQNLEKQSETFDLQYQKNRLYELSKPPSKTYLDLVGTRLKEVQEHVEKNICVGQNQTL